MQCTLISVGTLKEKYWTDALGEYTKRIGLYAKWEEKCVKEERLSDESPSAVRQALLLEGERILSLIPKDAYVVALCVEGKMLCSEELSELIDRARTLSGKICFIIGSSYGLSDAVKSRADFKLSFSRLTFPHQLIRVVLSEAIYRSFTMLNGKKYHK